MELTEIKSGIFGYNKKGVCQYVSALNDVHSAELDAERSKSEKLAEEFELRIKDLNSDNSSLNASIAELTAEVKELKELLDKLTEEKAEINEKYEALQAETDELRTKSDVISTAIINAEKCASTMINDADKRARDMIDAAQEKVVCEVNRLETAKTYIEQVRTTVEQTLRKIDSELGGIVGDITAKTEAVNSSGDRKANVKEKFGVLEKSFFKRA